MTEIVGVRFRDAGKIYYFDPGEISCAEGEKVIVETSRGIEIGEVFLANQMIEDDKIVAPLKTVIRIATVADLAKDAENRVREREAFGVCNEKIQKHELEMKLIDVEVTFDHSKILFYFTADGRVDFRELVKDLAAVFRTRIELRQIGVRDEAKIAGGIGVCGQTLCCSRFLEDFHPVSIKMAKDQGLSLNPTKISGTCGRLMCCLKYEQEAYEELIKKTPKPGAAVNTPLGTGVIVDVGLLRGELKIRLENAADQGIKHFKLGEVRLIPKDREREKPEKTEKQEKSKDKKTD